MKIRKDLLIRYMYGMADRKNEYYKENSAYIYDFKRKR